ncbi:MAG: hypothetical protein KGY81_09600, partial [Phycisphaerae bacterium]|nr:hypothetical protein [Phycisphaerae bacterium]
MKTLTCLLVLAMLAAATFADETANTLKRISEKVGGAFVVVRCQVKIATGTQAMGGMGICLDKSGLIMTQAIDARVDPETITQLEVIVPGVEQRALEARLLGIDPLTGMSFIKVSDSHDWQVVAFQKSAAIAHGKQVVSVGL